MTLTNAVKAVAWIVVLVCTTVTGGANATGTAHTCSGYGCHGRQPERFGCVPASVVTATARDDTGVVAELENRYSANCGTNRARGWLTSDGLRWRYGIYVRIHVTDGRGHREEMCSPGPSGAGALTERCTGYPYRAYHGPARLDTDMVDGARVTCAVIYVLDVNHRPVATAEACQ